MRWLDDITDSMDHKVLDTTERLNWTELILVFSRPWLPKLNFMGQPQISSSQIIFTPVPSCFYDTYQNKMLTLVQSKSHLFHARALHRAAGDSLTSVLSDLSLNTWP